MKDEEEAEAIERPQEQIRRHREFDRVSRTSAARSPQATTGAPGRAEDGQGSSAVKRRIQPGDKMAGRHGNKGRHLDHRAGRGHAVPGGWRPGRHRAEPAGRAVAHEHRPDPRTHLGWAPRAWGRRSAHAGLAQATSVASCASSCDKIYNHDSNRPKIASTSAFRRRRSLRWRSNLHRRVPMATPVFDGAAKPRSTMLELAGPGSDGQVTVLFDGRTGEAFEFRHGRLHATC